MCSLILYIVFTCNPHLKIYQRNLICTNNTSSIFKFLSTIFTHLAMLWWYKKGHAIASFAPSISKFFFRNLEYRNRENMNVQEEKDLTSIALQKCKQISLSSLRIISLFFIVIIKSQAPTFTFALYSSLQVLRKLNLLLLMLSVLSPKPTVITRSDDQPTSAIHSAYQVNVPSLSPHCQQATCNWSQHP